MKMSLSFSHPDVIPPVWLSFFCATKNNRFSVFSPILFWAPVDLIKWTKTGVFKALLLGKIQSIIHYNSSSSDKSVVLSYHNPTTTWFTVLNGFHTLFDQCIFLSWLRQRFHWINIYYGKRTCILVENNEFVYYSFLLHKMLIDWNGAAVDYFIGMFYQLFGLSFWRHPFTAEHPLLNKWWSVTIPVNIWVPKSGSL